MTVLIGIYSGGGWEPEAGGAAIGTSMGIVKKIHFMLVSLAPGSPGSSFRQVQVTILVLGLEKQLWLCFIPRPMFS